MIDAKGGVKTLEFNCRMGDPETQPIMLRLKSDLFELFELACAGALAQAEIDWDRRTVLGVTALGDSVKMAQRRAYQAAEAIRFDGMQFRRDIGPRAILAKKA